MVEENNDLSFVFVADSEGAIRFHSDSSFEGTPVDPSLLNVEGGAPEIRQVRITLQDEEIYATVIPVIDNRDKLRGTVIVGLKGRVISGKVSDMVWRAVAFGSISIALMLLFIMLFISSAITKPIDMLVSTAGAVAEGDLTKQISGASDNEIGALYKAFGDMLNSLRDLQGRVAVSFEELENAIGEVTTHSGDLQSSADKQAGAVEEISTFIQHMNRQARNITGSMDNLSRTSEETSSSIMEMMASIEQVAQNSESLSSSVNETSSSMEEVLVSNREVANNIELLDQLISQTSTAVTEIDASVKEVQNLAQESRKVADEVRVNAEKDGSDAVEETILEMGKIREAVMSLSDTVNTLDSSVDNIGAILNVIDDVAEQTNLLALNAAIIAAQAGEHGRGFAVVADEIRELAERTSSSTKEISKVITGIQTETKTVGKLVKDSVGRVDRGTESVGRTDNALRKIIESSEKSVDMSGRIAQATAEQASGSREVARSIHDVSERSNQISRATTEQGRGNETIIRSIENMRDLAEQLRKATVEQASGAKLIAKAGEGATLLSQEVSKAAQEGSNLSDQAVNEVNAIGAGNKETLEVVSRMRELVEKFGALSANLKKTLSHFRT
jgi:methyl-accepting chemotaxis protein